MGIVNLTPDSFFPDSRATSVDDAIERIKRWVEKGAAFIDLGAVSTRPGAEDVSQEEEWRRLEPVLSAIAKNPDVIGKAMISIDTTRAEIVRRAHAVIGRFLVNDISAGEDDPEMLKMVGRLGLPYVAMHKRGTPKTMDSLVDYGDIVDDVIDYFKTFSKKAELANIKEWYLDPGFGFAKTKQQNLELLDRLEELKVVGVPILVGIADKRFTFDEQGKSHSSELEAKAIKLGADIIRCHQQPKTE